MAGSGLVRAEVRGGVRLLWLIAPPGNLFGPALCAAVMAALQDAMAAADTRAIVLISGLRGQGQGFSGGIDLADLGTPWPAGAPTPADIARMIMAAPRPVIAALHGPVLGAGAEIALAARARVSSPDLRFGLRDLLVGRLPMAGGTQTLPRLIGAVEALRLIGKGISVSAGEAVAMGIVDAVTEGDLIAAALGMAENPPAVAHARGLRDGRGYQEAVALARTDAGVDAALTALADCVEAAQLLPPEQGLEFEAEAAQAIAERPEAAALQHLMVAEMRMVADLAGGQPVRKIGLWGAATWPLILPALRAGIEVVLADDDRPALLQAVEKVALAQESLVANGRLAPATRDLEWARLRPSLLASDLGGIALVIAAKPGAGHSVLHYGMRADQPPDAARLLLIAPAFAELQVPRAQRSFGRLAAATLRQMRMRLAVTESPPASGIARAIVLAAQTACSALMAQGLPKGDIAAALVGVMRLSVPDVPIGMQGRLLLPVQSIRDRILGAVAAEAVRILAQGGMRRAACLDVLATISLGMPRETGGPLFAADLRGLLLVRRDLAQWQHDHPVWTPPPMLDQLVSRGARLARVDVDNLD